MLELVAESTDARQRLEIPLEDGSVLELGRDPAADIAVPWDHLVSRRHLRIAAHRDRIECRRLESARNPLFYAGAQVDSCTVRPGDSFVVGTTRFHLIETGSAEHVSDAPPIEEVTFDRQELRKVRFRDADKRIDVLAHLPEVILGSRSDQELHHRLANLILAGVPNAEAVAIVKLGESRDVQLLHWDRRRETAGSFRPSHRLVLEALDREGRSVLNVWKSGAARATDYTEMAEFDWAFCTPVLEASREPWGLYVAGRLDLPFLDGRNVGSDRALLHPDVKFTELVAEIIAAVQRLNHVERKLSGLRQFFAPPILAALGGLSGVGDLNTELLKPRECDVTVMFCDLRGFSQKAEESAGDLLGLLNRVSRALGVMTEEILKHGGVTGDFQGDAALGFWGWPFASEHAPLDACRAALGIRAAFEQTADRPDHPLANFRMGIGIAHGRAVAGGIGTSEQLKFTVFGPVVNLASRLEGMTKQLRVPIVLDEATARLARERLDPHEGRIRRLARLLPFGMERPVDVSELLPPESALPTLTAAHIATYEQGVEHFVRGRWEEAYSCLHAMPASDRAQDFLGMHIAQHNRVAPAGWDGVIRLPSK